MEMIEIAALLAGLGTLLVGVGVLWFVTVYKEINRNKE
jgi:hypothetical protein